MGISESEVDLSDYASVRSIVRIACGTNDGRAIELSDNFVEEKSERLNNPNSDIFVNRAFRKIQKIIKTLTEKSGCNVLLSMVRNRRSFLIVQHLRSILLLLEHDVPC